MAPAFHYCFLFFTILLSSILISPSLSELCNPADKKALLAIKQAFNNPRVLTSWDPDTDCCTDWDDIVQCDPTTNRIVSFELYNSDLNGQIPAVIGDLPYLKELTLHKHPNLTGPIPAAITKLKNLQYLMLTWSNLTGNIPSFLGNLPNLANLHLSFNNFTGSIPSSLSKLTNLRSLRLDRNKLTGKIPSSLGLIKKEDDFFLVLSHNQLSGKVPTSLQNVDFGLVDLSRNMLEGDISMFFGPNKTTNGMDFSRNMFKFNMSELEIYDSLMSLDVNHNQIYGSIPQAITKLDNLYFFNVSYNRLCGQIPVGGKLQTFGVTEYFHNRCLCGAPLNVTCN